MIDDLLQQAIFAIKAGDKARGQQLLIRILEQNARNEMAWLWMSQCVDNQEHKLDCLKRVLDINPNNTIAQKELARIQTLEKIKAPPVSTPTQSPSPQKIQKRKSWIGYIVVAAILVFCICAIVPFLLLPSNTSQSSQPSSSSVPNTTGVHRISGDIWFGCTDRDYFQKIIGYAVDQDKEAFRQALTTGIYSGICTMFNNGETVYVTDTAILSGLIKVRRQGETPEYWTNIEAIK